MRDCSGKPTGPEPTPGRGLGTESPTRSLGACPKKALGILTAYLLPAYSILHYI